MVGFDAVLQHTPLIVTVAPPSAVTVFSEQVAVVAVMPVIWPVVTVGFDVGGSGFSCGPQEYNIKPIVSSKKIFFIIDSLLFHRLYFRISSLCNIVKNTHFIKHDFEIGRFEFEFGNFDWKGGIVIV